MTSQVSSKSSSIFKRITPATPKGLSQGISAAEASSTALTAGQRIPPSISEAPSKSTSTLDSKKLKLKQIIGTKNAVVQEEKKSDAITPSPWKSRNTIAIVGGIPPSAIGYRHPGSSSTSASSFASRKSAICAPEQQPTLPVASSHIGQGSSIAIRNMPTDRLYEPKVFEKGVVLCVPTHSHQYDQRAYNATNPDQSMSSLGVVNSKYRKYIVVARFAKHAVGLPIYTYQGNGLTHKDPSNKAEHISVRESEHKNACAMAATSHGILYSRVDRRLCDRTIPFHRMTDQTVCKYTEPYCISFTTKCTIFGRLESQSADLIQQLFQESVNRSVDPNRTPTRGSCAIGGSMIGSGQLFSQNHNIGGSTVAGGRLMR